MLAVTLGDLVSRPAPAPEECIVSDTVLLALSGLLIVAYLLELFGRRVRLPGVVLLIATGMLAVTSWTPQACNCASSKRWCP